MEKTFQLNQPHQHDNLSLFEHAVLFLLLRTNNRDKIAEYLLSDKQTVEQTITALQSKFAVEFDDDLLEDADLSGYCSAIVNDSFGVSHKQLLEQLYD